MALTAGTFELGPSAGTLSVRTRKGGAAAKAGHNLLIEVTRWTATLEVGENGAPTRIELTADPSSLQVREGTGGISSLGDDDKSGIKQTIEQEVLKGGAIAFRSSAVEGSAGSARLAVTGEVAVGEQRQPVAFALSCADRRLTGSATVTQSGFGMKPYTALFGTLKVVDEVTVEVTAQLANESH
jgi:polyisoprenoid-binding protein YceI